MGSVFLRENSYVVKYKNEYGNWKKKSVGKKPAMTKTMARAILNNIERKIKLGEHKLVDSIIPALNVYQRNIHCENCTRSFKVTTFRFVKLLTRLIKFYQNFAIKTPLTYLYY